jgi:hypothetical protein
MERYEVNKTLQQFEKPSLSLTNAIRAQKSLEEKYQSLNQD